MTEHRTNFKAWYADVLARLYPDRNAGIAVLMISFPLAERYLRQKNGVGPEVNLTDTCIASLVVIFPALRDVATARQFWTIYRHGFLHQASLSAIARSGAALPMGWLTHDMVDAIQIQADGSFRLHPVEFSKKIVSGIEADFEAFAGRVGGAPALPTVERLDPVTIPSTYLGTRSRP